MRQNETEAAAEWVSVDDLTPWAANPRRNEAAIPHVMASIRRFGFGAPVLARRANGEIIAGHTRIEAARRLGIDRVPVRFLDLDPADAHLLAVADNKLGEIADWDDGLLAEALEDVGEDTEGLGFSEEELRNIVSPVVEQPEIREWSDHALRSPEMVVVLIAAPFSERSAIERAMADALPAWPHKVAITFKDGGLPLAADAQLQD